METEDVTFVPLMRPEGPRSGGHVTIALYAGMTAKELQAVVRAALGLPAGTTCSGFIVSPQGDATGKKKQPQLRPSAPTAELSSSRQGGVLRERVVPLTVACVSPEVLTATGGSVKVLLSSTGSTARKPRAPVVAPIPPTRGSHAAASVSTSQDKETIERLQRLINALREDDKSISSFEAAVLAEICEQRAHEVLTTVRGHQSVATKKQYLLSLVRSPEPADATPALAPPLPMTVRSNGEATSEASAQIDLICKKVVSIAHTVFSPHVQSDLMTEASLYREKYRKIHAHNARNRSTNGASSTVAAPVNVSSIMELLGVVERLLNKHALQEEQSVKLIRLILAENRLLVSALQSYKLDFNLNELEHTIKRMAALGGSASAPTVGDIPTEAKKTSRPSSRHSSPRKTKRKDRKGFIVRPHDILHTLYQKQMITTLELDLLRALVTQNDSQVLAAVDEYEQTRRLGSLRDHLVNIVGEITQELGDDERYAALMRSSMEEDPDQALAAALNNWQENLIQFVQRWFSERKLTLEHVQVLRALIEENHNLLQSSYEVFVTDEDENELLDTLSRIAKLQLQAQEGTRLLAFTQVVEEHCDVLRGHEKTLVKQLFARKNELVRAAWEVFEVERNVEDFGDTLLRIARFTTRQDSKVRIVEVVGEMMRRQLIRSHEADGLLRLFEEKNDAMVAAKEAFESDGDVTELVETLLLIVKHANFGEPPICSPRNAVPKTPPSSPVIPDRVEEEQAVATRLIEILCSSGRLAQWQADLLLALLVRGDERVLAVMDVYNDDRDARELVDTLWRLCDLTAWEQNRGRIVSEWIEPLEVSGQVPKGVLQKLVNARDDRLVAAFVVFLGDGNGAEFSDTLAHLGRIVAKQPLRLRKASNVEQATEPLVDEQVTQVLDTLVFEGALSADVREQVSARINAKDAAALAALDVYAETQDVQDLADTLQRILTRRQRKTSDTNATPLSPTRASVMEKQLLHFASELELASGELVALKRAIARRDSTVEAVVQVYSTETQNEEELKNTLRSIAANLAVASRP
ncbi:hypothetical protein Poli38472_010850 [Pythium oligandrum]|uniref:Uncharacterized protein n=1 Tax=Pythium oligandrum TaxID=41045 RepID=A0A8K1FJG7_PYTOL|nr:hypothetical protein Poli38472_010850 [Pythium oligandrum]|eukprot:TMW61787.1 hypothetical protein Poli38472_010850 [Pythium oligandrum]